MTSKSSAVYADELFRTRYEKECVWVHKLMTWIMVGQWLMGVAFALFWSPFTWIGQEQEVHIHVWAAIVFGAALSGFAICWMRFFPKESSTRHAVAITQVLWSALLIHLSGGRIETHFHVFISLAILSIYRDWKILISATVVVAVDHFVRGVFYPASVFGVFSESPFRWMEHAAWVVFEVAFLAPACYQLRNDVRELCISQSEIREAKENVDSLVEERTRELSQANELLEEKTAEAEKLAMVAKYTDNAVVITDERGAIEWINSGYTRITGYSRAEVIGKQSAELLHGPETDCATIEMMRDAFQNRQGFNTEILNYRKSGKPFWQAIEVRPIVDTHDGEKRFIAIQSDVTNRKCIETSLADAEARIRSIINNVPGAFFRREIVEGESSRTIFVSEFIKQLTGHASEEFTCDGGLSHLDFVHPDDIKALTKKLNHCLQDEGDFEHEYRMVASDQTVRWISERGQCKANSDSSSNEYVIDGILLDVTDRIESEQRNMELQAELLDASRQAGMAEISTGVLHNVGNVLNSLNVSAATIQKRYNKSPLTNLEKISALIAENENGFGAFVTNDERGKKVPRYIQKVTGALCHEQQKITEEFNALQKSVEHIKEIISVQQSMAKASGMTQELDPTELIRDAIATNTGLQNFRIRVVNLTDDSFPTFVSDKPRIMQILINLIKNSVDALTENSTENPYICVGATSDKQTVTFRVADNGIGIPKEKLSQIFQHGFTTKSTGHGFGLHSSANAATEMGGKLSVSSGGIGKGATFSLQLPIKPPKTTTDNSSSEPVTSHHNNRDTQ